MTRQDNNHVTQLTKKNKKMGKLKKYKNWIPNRQKKLIEIQLKIHKL